MHARSVFTATILLAVPLLAQEPLPVASPRIISAPGSYQLVSDIDFDATREFALSITASGVTLDLNGHQIKGPGGRQGIGIRVSGATGVRIRNGRIADTAFGLVIDNSHNVTITGLEIRGQGLAVPAHPPETAIMIVQSRSVVFEGNNVYNTPLGVFVRGSRSWGNRISGNTITSTNGAIGICYNPAPGDPNGPRGDLISDNLVAGFGVSVQMTNSASNVIRQNTLLFRTSSVEMNGAMDTDMENVKVQMR